MASIYLPPIARKKKVNGWPRNDTFRVFADFKEESTSKSSRTSYSSQFVRHNVPPTPQRALSAGRKNRPQPNAVSFLRQNPRFVCEPICHVETVVDNQELFHPWWPNELPEKEVKKPLHSMDSTSRSDYAQTSSSQRKQTRFGCNPNKSKVAMGIVPECSAPVLLHSADHKNSEKISYEHQYNSRLDPNEPVRGRRHGCFVWKPVIKTGRKHSVQKSEESISLPTESNCERMDTEPPQFKPEGEKLSPNGCSKSVTAQLEKSPGQSTNNTSPSKAEIAQEKLGGDSGIEKVFSPPPHVV